ncbi:hypothetical protein CONCODRAFT_84306 [Conidiobolus coronatus NRRL 28638]|uniref:Uncharacterized protein n=1 Tax=Conidiobolus coronatus (strain ATCC 28846 / CBS 209.66 / NRRL 28638) TaxID=796925 RepID=A0A137PAK5_CONC2|nr:hypothetical protein CONCODRAFT_84306 [Conidiobolus coronatus NRRL 28638]|eukprot:KXN72037.1 hypothetical protein CONCODRAFT_84306 [Conidiobolus coronatus NRRL 28638]
MARSKITSNKTEKQQLSSYDSKDDGNSQPLSNRQKIKRLLRKPIVFTFAMNFILVLSTLTVTKLVKSDALVPRASEENLTGASYRLKCAYQNFLDHYPLYMSAIMLSAFKKTNTNYQLSLNLIILATRLLHPIGYVLNIALLRGFSYQSSQVATTFLFLCSILKEDKFQSVLNFL